MDGIESIIEHLEAQKAAIDKALEALREVGVTEAPVREETANARSIAQKARWAAKKAGKKKGGLTAAGRKRLSDNMKKRWAAKQAPNRKRGRKKAA